HPGAALHIYPSPTGGKILINGCDKSLIFDLNKNEFYAIIQKFELNKPYLKYKLSKRGLGSPAVWSPNGKKVAFTDAGGIGVGVGVIVVDIP
ncbi:MAG: hypothetical protein J7L42_05450, partial [Elusimicrobia bacterium]|nr:hypothetical protein [Elusimicrobiota bacterium]